MSYLLAQRFINSHILVDPNATTSRSAIRNAYIGVVGDTRGRNTLYAMLDLLPKVSFVNGLYYGLKLTEFKLNIDGSSIDEMLKKNEFEDRRRILKPRPVRNAPRIKTEPQYTSAKKSKGKGKGKGVKRNASEYNKRDLEFLSTLVADKVVSKVVGRAMLNTCDVKPSIKQISNKKRCTFGFNSVVKALEDVVSGSDMSYDAEESSDSDNMVVSDNADSDVEFIATKRQIVYEIDSDVEILEDTSLETALLKLELQAKQEPIIID